MPRSLALYRKYLPTTFDELIGQEHVVRTLTNALKLGRVGHAYLFVGPRGTGKTTTARLLAKAVSCETREKSGEACGICVSCDAFIQARHPDLIEIDAATYTGVDNIREIRESARIAPLQSEYKIFVIDEAHMLSKSAVNALLKILEEPPPHVIFILATTEVEKIPPTIISRTQRFDFRALSVTEIAGRLRSLAVQEGVDIDDDALELLAQAADGSVRDGESLLEQVLSFIGEKASREDVMQLLGIPDPLIVRDLARALFRRDAGTALKLVEESVGRGSDPSVLTARLAAYARDVLLTAVDEQLLPIIERRGGKAHAEGVKQDAKTADQQALLTLIPKLIEAAEWTKRSPIPQLPLEIVIAEHSSEPGSVPVAGD